ncbi:hypothetical protein F7725_027308 [Dissostichus mawsoni]|uniref:Tudor domain-containing protein n=1 Tax=Dissostichus mawsoni TaxID=36200 RepID=A0A7J5XCL9_DISMA|nr:hypothetical protein F7725_027308 [Dissostichus mawsoni]
MAEPAEIPVLSRPVEPEGVMAAIKEETSLVEAFENNFEISQGVKPAASAASEETESREKPDDEEDGQQDEEKESPPDGQPTVDPPAAESSSTEPKVMTASAASEETESREKPDDEEDGQQDEEEESPPDGQPTVDPPAAESSSTEPKGVKPAASAASEETESREKPDDEEDGQQDEEKESPPDGQPTVDPPAAESSSTEPKWAVGAACRAVWSDDRTVYPAIVVSLDGERCRVRFNDYGNYEDLALSELKAPDDAPQTPIHNSLDWKPGSLCRAVYSEDSMVYQAVVLWVKGERCCVRFNGYENEEEQDVSSLLSLGALHGNSMAAAAKVNICVSTVSSKTNVDWKRRGEERRTRGREQGKRKTRGERREREEVRGERRTRGREQGKRRTRGREQGERRSGGREEEEQNFSWPKEKASNNHQSKVEKESEEKQNDETQTPPNISAGDDASSSMLMLWYMCGFHTGSYMVSETFKSSSNAQKQLTPDVSVKLQITKKITFEAQQAFNSNSTD